MKALRKTRPGPDGITVCELDVPKPADREILVRVSYAGICGTDLHILHDEYPACIPVTMGHEFSGTVAALGEAVTEFSVGDRVVAHTAGIVCGRCEYCRRGLLMLCKQRRSIGSGVDGAMAEYVLVSADRAFRLPEGVPLREAALCEPLACCVRSVIETSSVHAGDFVYVSGPGTIGQIVAQLAKGCGAYVVVGGTQMDRERLKLAKTLGADETIDVTKTDIMDAAERLTKGSFFHVVFECAGARASAETCLTVLRKAGEYAQVGLFGKPILFDMDLALTKEARIVTSYASEPSSWEIALRLLEQGKLVLSPLVSAEYPLKEWEKAFGAAADKSGYKILLCLSHNEER